jgi:hypothetical protein
MPTDPRARRSLPAYYDEDDEDDEDDNDNENETTNNHAQHEPSFTKSGVETLPHASSFCPGVPSTLSPPPPLFCSVSPPGAMRPNARLMCDASLPTTVKYCNGGNVTHSSG